MRRFGRDEQSPQDELDTPSWGQRLRGSARDWFGQMVSWSDGSRARTAVIGAIAVGVIVVWMLLVMLLFARQGPTATVVDPTSATTAAVVVPVGADGLSPGRRAA
ncbi:hypothetical protein E4P34_03265 [Kocuria rhizophila]|uniref:Uncharacterized protein n=1 Tax=Kocuria rhizophila TaxID=72000 RepID=A0AAX2SAY0_KOCRH|nr:hypothetical protein [Kocuria rhizophila]TFI02175.1 hypothetical protein E4P33_03775 [Kocuria rhizophila]TFI09627.1 hypothetical protein E4P34_03265 [Kocuria rhizophila]